MSLAKSKPEATCLLTGATESPAGSSPLIGRFTTEDTHTHIVALNATKPSTNVVSAMTDAETMAHMYGVSPEALDLLGVEGIKVHAASTTHKGPVGLTFSTSCPTAKTFKPIETLTRATFQSLAHGETDAGALAHHIALPTSAGFQQPPTIIRFNESTQVPDATAANLALRRFKWPYMPMTPENDYNTVQHETLGTLHAVPLATGSNMAECNVSHLLSTNIERIPTICGSDTKVVTTAAGMKFALVPDAALDKVKDQLKQSFETSSCLNGGLRISAYPLSGGSMDAGCTTTVCYSLMKGKDTVAAKCAAAMTDADAMHSHIETVTKAHIGAYLGDSTEEGTAALMVPQSDAQLVGELSALAHA